jgi:hypothetical protein
MDEHTRQNWQKIKEVLEETGKTDCFFINVLVQF